MIGREVQNHLRHPLVVPIAFFILGIFPWGLHLLLFYSDERFYVDASILMVQTGDYTVPRYGDGSPRLNKPLLTYWVMAGSYHLFGIHVAAARLPFLLAGIGTLLLTYAISRTLTRNEEVTRMAVWILLANPLFWLSSSRCLPDILLGFFLALATLGYVLLRFGSRKRHVQGVWLVAFGLGLGVATKGIPALLFGNCLLLHAIMTKMPIREALRPWHGIAASVGLGIALLGFLPTLQGHREQMVHAVVHDEVTQRLRVGARGMSPFLQGAAAFFAVTIVPWILPGCLQKRWRGPNLGDARQVLLWGTVGIWFLAVAVTENFSIRYFVPVLPMVAVLTSHYLCETNARVLNVYGRVWSLLIFLTAVAAVGMATILLLQLQPANATSDTVVLLAGIAIGLAPWLEGYREGLPGIRRNIASTCGISLVLFSSASTLYLPDLGEQVASVMRAQPGGASEILAAVTPCQACRIRLALPEYHVRPMTMGERGTWNMMGSAKVDLELSEGVLAASCMENGTFASALSALRDNRLPKWVESQRILYFLRTHHSDHGIRWQVSSMNQVQ